MNKIIATICLGLWMCLSGVLYAVSDQAVTDEATSGEETQADALSFDPEDELLRLLELEEAEEKAREQVQPQTTQQVADIEAIKSDEMLKPEVAKPVKFASTVVLDIKEPNQVNELTPISLNSGEKEDFRNLRKKLIFGQMEPVDQMTEEEKADSLDKLIQQLQSLETPRKITPEQPAVDLPDPTPAVQVPETTAPAQIKVTPEPETPKDNLLSQLEKADHILDPFRLADVMYRQQYYEQAFQYYQAAMETLSPEDTSNRQWVLFQMGNCARQTDPIKAIEIYTGLIESYPNAKWTEIAMARRSILQWSRENKIDQLITGAAQ